MDGWESVFKLDPVDGWEVLCCAIGVSGNACFPPSASDYVSTCQDLFPDLTTGENCDCGSLCTGTVFKNGSTVTCEGECICSGVCCDDGAPCTNAPTPVPTAPSTTAMICMEGWETVFVEGSGGVWSIMCCRNGVVGGVCSPPSQFDFVATCDILFTTLTPNSTCNCGSLCNGTVVWDGVNDPRCEGDCVCTGVCCEDGAQCISTPPPSPTDAKSMSLVFGSAAAIFVIGGLYGLYVYSQGFLGGGGGVSYFTQSYGGGGNGDNRGITLRGHRKIV